MRTEVRLLSQLSDGIRMRQRVLAMLQFPEDTYVIPEVTSRRLHSGFWGTRETMKGASVIQVHVYLPSSTEDGIGWCLLEVLENKRTLVTNLESRGMSASGLLL